MISTRSLINLSHRVGTALRSGVDTRKVWELETRHASGPLKSQLDAIRRRVSAGDPVADAMRSANGYFPPMFVQMVEVGEATGKLDEVLLRLAEHYEHQQQMRRTFWLGIAWPLFELVFAVLVIGGLIFILGMLNTGQTILGIPMGTSTALLWFLGCGLIAGTIALTAHALARGWLGPQPVLLAMKIPVLGKSLESLALSRLTWSLAISLDSGMDASRAVKMSIRAAQNPYYESALPRVAGGIRANQEFHESFRAAGVFPADFLDSLEAAELAGATTESLLRLAKEYENRARTAIRVLTGIATVGVMLLVFGVIIAAIFTLFFELYMKPINEALEMTQPGKF
ncbi:MAG: type II secretion system F family protein [Pirellulaceae bacterium]